MPLQFNAFTVGIFAVVAIGSIIYNIYTNSNFHQNCKQDSHQSFAFSPGYDTKFKDTSSTDENKRKRKVRIECTICCEVIIKDEMKLKCNHSFHGTCLKPWLKSHNTCPNCRLTI